MGFLSGFVDKMVENANEKALAQQAEQWSSQSFRKNEYNKFRGSLEDKSRAEKKYLLTELIMPLIPREYIDECIEYLGFPLLEDELDDERECGYENLFDCIETWEYSEEEKFKKAWTLLTADEQEKYKLWKSIHSAIIDCREHLDLKPDCSNLDDADFKLFDAATRDENIYRLLHSYEAEGKTVELKMALSYMKDDEKEAYKAKKAASASAPKATPQPQAPVPQQPVAATPSPAHAVQASAPVAQALASAEDELEAKLSKLKNLFDKGLISQEDFDKKKSDVLMNL